METRIGANRSRGVDLRIEQLKVTDADQKQILFDLPMTAHCIGGCVMGTDAEHGVIDADSRLTGRLR